MGAKPEQGQTVSPGHADSSSKTRRLFGGHMETPDNRSAVLTVPEVAELLASNPWTVYEAIKAGTFPLQPIRVGRKILFARSRVDELLGRTPNEITQRGPILEDLTG